MGRLTDDMTCLAGEIRTGHQARGRMVEGLRRGMIARKRIVGAMMKGAHAAHAEMTRNQRRGLASFKSGIERQVRTLRAAMANDLAGCRAAWSGRAATLATGPAGHSPREAPGAPLTKKRKD